MNNSLQNNKGLEEKFDSKSSLEYKICPPKDGYVPATAEKPDNIYSKDEIYKINNYYDSNKNGKDLCTGKYVHLDDAKKCYENHSNITNMKGLKDLGNVHTASSAVKYMGTNYINSYNDGGSFGKKKNSLQ